MFSGKSGCIPARWLSSVRVVLIGQECVISGKVVVFGKQVVIFGQSGCIRAKVVVLGQKLLYSGKKGSIRARWLFSLYVVVFGQKLL